MFQFATLPADPMDLNFCSLAGRTPGAVAIRESMWMFGDSSVHVLSLGVFLGPSMLDRLLGLRMRTTRFRSRRSFALTRASFILMALSGALLIWSEAVNCYATPVSHQMRSFFCGLNILVFHPENLSHGRGWDQAVHLPARAKSTVSYRSPVDRRSAAGGQWV
jgi:hypothetical protein